MHNLHCFWNRIRSQGFRRPPWAPQGRTSTDKIGPGFILFSSQHASFLYMVFGPTGNRRLLGSGRPRRPGKHVQKVRHEPQEKGGGSGRRHCKYFGSHSNVSGPGRAFRGRFWSALSCRPNTNGPKTGPKLLGPKGRAVWDRFWSVRVRLAATTGIKPAPEARSGGKRSCVI